MVNVQKNSTRRGESKKIWSQKVVIAVIVLAALAVVVAAICALKFDTKFQVESQIKYLAQNYYEEYYYPNLSPNDEMSLEEVLAQFSESGLTAVSLRKLLLLAPAANDSMADYLREHCDENLTTVTYYPEEPYQHNSFQTEYSYACNF